MTGTIEGRSLFVLLFTLFALAVPATAAFPGEIALPASAQAQAPHEAVSLILLQNAPPPLIVMAIGTAIVAFTVMRRVRRSGLGPNADRS